MSSLLPFRRSGVTVFRVKGIPVTIGFSWFILAILIVGLYAPMVARSVPSIESGGGAYIFAALFALTLLLSVFLHELGHALVARHYSIPVRSITLDALGGFTEMEYEADRPAPGAWIALAGPAVSAVIGILALVAAWNLPVGTIAWLLAFQVALANILVAAYNLLPGMPLDGGKAIQSAIWAVTKNQWTGYRWAGHLGHVIAGATILAGFWLYFQPWISLSWIGLVLVLLVSIEMWRGATGSIKYAKTGELVADIKAARFTRPVAAIDPDDTLAEALDKAAGRLMVVMRDGTIIGLVDPVAASAVPEEKTSTMSLTGLLEPSARVGTMSATAAGRSLIQQLYKDNKDYYWVVEDRRLTGVLSAADVAAVLR